MIEKYWRMYGLATQVTLITLSFLTAQLLLEQNYWAVGLGCFVLLVSFVWRKSLRRRFVQTQGLKHESVEKGLSFVLVVGGGFLGLMIGGVYDLFTDGMSAGLKGKAIFACQIMQALGYALLAFLSLKITLMSEEVMEEVHRDRKKC